MTIQEFSDNFDTLLASYRGVNEAGFLSNPLSLEFDEYEKSVFLTNAQEEFVRNSYRGLNNLRESFEETEIKRRYLDVLIKQSNILSTFASEETISDISKFFLIPQELMFIINERLRILSSNECFNNKIIDVVPIRHDEYNMQKDNPFRKPKLTGRTINAWRMDYGDIANQRVVELIPPQGSTADRYIVRYLRKPRPIVLVNLTSNSIQGVTTAQTSELNNIVHNQILELAVQKAIQSIPTTREN